MYDLLIRGGAIVDGSGEPRRLGDIAIKDGKIAAIESRIDAPAHETIDAAGKIVTPGFVDIHTHYDAQVMWDETLDSSFSNGVTTAIAGNCGVGFAPIRPEFRRELVEMMEGVEDIPGIVIDEGLDWSWRTFPDYLDKIAARHYTMDVAFHITHAPLRVYVMGERALAHEPATEADVAKMARIVREAVEAGAVGFSASRILEHRSSKGAFVPGTFTEDGELEAIARALGEAGRGVFQIVPLGAAGDFAGNGTSQEDRDTEHERLVRLAELAGRPLTYLLMRPDDSPADWLTMVAQSDKAVRERGVDLYPQIHGRGVGLLITLDGYHPFQLRPSYMAITQLPLAERLKRMRDPAVRAAILAEPNVDAAAAPSDRIRHIVENFFVGKLGPYFLMDLPLDYEPSTDRLVSTVAAATARSEEGVVYDHITAGEGRQFAAFFAQNYGSGDLAETGQLLMHPLTRLGLADGGAHLQFSCDAALPTFQLTHWARDRKRGPTLPIEQIVRGLTHDNASLYGMDDRGLLAVGKRADINVIDIDGLSLDLPVMAHDLPEGGKRLIQFAKGYAATIVNGTVTRRNDQDTGARPGRLYRSQRPQ